MPQRLLLKGFIVLVHVNKGFIMAYIPKNPKPHLKNGRKKIEKEATK
jgi:hypothetical protein